MFLLFDNVLIAFPFVFHSDMFAVNLAQFAELGVLSFCSFPVFLVSYSLSIPLMSNL